MALDKGHPKITIVRIIFLFSVVRLKKPVIESLVPKMKDLEELLVATSFPSKFHKTMNRFIVKMGSKCPLRHLHQFSRHTCTRTKFF